METVSGPQIEQACLAVINPVSNEALTAATVFLNRCSKHISSVMPLHALLKHGNPGVRQLASIFLRKVVQRHWSKLGAKGQKEVRRFRSSLLVALTQEPSRDVRNGLCELIAKVAKFGEWRELLQFINQAAVAPEPPAREVAFKLLQSMSESVTKFVKDSFPQLQPMLLRGLADAESVVRVRALRALNTIAGSLENEREAKLLHALVEPSVKVTGFCIENGQVADALEALELFNELLTVPELEGALKGYIPQLMQFMLSLVTAKVDMHLRDQAMTFVQNVAISRTKQFVSNKWFEAVLQMAGPMLTEPLDPEEADDDVTSQRIFVSAIDVLCNSLPQKYSGPRVLALAVHLSQSQNWMERKGALEILAVASQGCFVFMQDHFKDFLPILVAGFSDSVAHVRQSACVALAHFSEQLRAEVMPHHEIFVPLLVKAMRDSDAVAMRALYALQFFSEGLLDGFIPYADSFMSACLTFTQSPVPMVRETSIGAVGSIAVALGPHFVKYLPPVVQMLRTYMALTHEDDMEIRARATEVAGTVAKCVGRAAMGPVLEEFAGMAMKAFADTSQHQWELRQHAYGFFANLADVLGPDFLQLVPTLAPLVLASLQSEEGILRRGRTNEAHGLEALIDAGDDGDDDVELDEQGNPAHGIEVGQRVNVSVRVPFTEEKKMAIVLAASTCHVLGKAVLPYAQAWLPEMLELLSFLQSDVRENAARALPDLLHVISDTWPAPSGKWERGRFSDAKPLSPQLMEVSAPVMRSLIDLVKEDRELEAAICAVEALDRIIKELGPCVMEPHLSVLVSALVLVFQKKTFCQSLREQFDSDDRDLELFNVAVDLVSTMAAAAGPTPVSTELAKVLVPLFKVMAHKDQPDTFQALAFGALAELAVHAEQAIAPVAAEMMRLALEGTVAEDVVTRRNAIYCAGAVVQFGGPSVLGAIPNVFTCAKRFYGGGADFELDEAGRDNAAGALARIILTGVEGSHVSECVGGIAAALPLQADTEPYAPIYHAFIKLLRASGTQMLVAPHIVLLVTTALMALTAPAKPGTGELIDKSRAALETFLRVMTMNAETKQVVVMTAQHLAPSPKAIELKQKLGL